MSRANDTAGCRQQPLRRKRATLEVRARCVQAIRQFFISRDFLEVETPVRMRAPLPELHITPEPSGEYFLRTSPESHMKQLLSAGYERIFQLGPCFRSGERGELHHPEFTMLEWYRAHAGYEEILEDTRALILHVAHSVWGTSVFQRAGRTIHLDQPWSVWAVRDAFLEFAGWDPVVAYNSDRFDLDLVDKVEPALARLETPVVLKDYPIAAAALARPSPGNTALAERWELYIGGVELANAYSELIDPDEQRRRFQNVCALREGSGEPPGPFPERFLNALEKGMPPSGGIALGVDRLVLCGMNAESLEEVTAFQE